MCGILHTIQSTFTYVLRSSRKKLKLPFKIIKETTHILKCKYVLKIFPDMVIISLHNGLRNKICGRCMNRCKCQSGRENNTVVRDGNTDYLNG